MTYHRETMGKLQKLLFEKGIEDAIELEQDILSGVNSQTYKEIKGENLFNRVKKFSQKYKMDQMMIFRVISIFLLTYNVPETKID